ncbi:MAG: hypothetical protein J6R04_02760 [Clostridia bacterium]|nr:hypothetical protein [Clostridia bacterium]
MRKILTLMLVCLLVALPALGLVGCNDTPSVPDTPDAPDTPSNPDQPNDPTDTPNDPTEPSDGIVLVADGVTQYRIVRSDFAKDDVKSLATAIRKAIETVTGVKLALVTDYEDENNNADIKEILVGKTNRAETSTFSAKLSGTEYGYEVIGNKIVIAGGSNALLSFAVASFLQNCVGYTSEDQFTMNKNLILPKNLSVIKSNDHSRDVVLYTAKSDVPYLDALQKSLEPVVSSLTLKTQHDAPASVFNAQQYGLVLVAGADTFPRAALNAISGYLNAGGRVLFLGGPTFYDLVTFYNVGGELMTHDEYAQFLYDALDPDDASVLLNTTLPGMTGSLTRATQDYNAPYRWSVGNYGLKGSSNQFYHEAGVSPTNTWDMLSVNVSVKRNDNNLLLVDAKPGNEDTDHVTIELKESDGTRWYANIIFESNDWQTYMLTAKDFTYFQGGTKKDSIKFDNVNHMQIGYATSFYEIGNKQYAYYMSLPSLYHVDGLATAEGGEPFKMDTISPLYEQYPITNAANLIVEHEQVFISERNYVVPEELFSCHPGRQGNGFDKKSESRFIPLLRVTDEKGLHSGYAAWIQLFSSSNSANGALEGTMVGCFSASSYDFYNADGIAAITEAVTAMTRNSFIVDGGTTEYLYVEEATDDIIYGANYITLNGGSTANMTLNVSLYRGDECIEKFDANLNSAVASTSGVRTLQNRYDLSNGKPDRAVATITLDGKVIDRVEHAIRFWSPKPLAERSYVYVEDGYFKRDGKIVNLFGVNYLPSYNVANYPEENVSGSYYNQYCADPAYDPEVIAYDLARIKDLGMNAISFSCNGTTNNLLDLILQCEELGIYVDLSINGRGAYPLSGFGLESATNVLTTRYLDQIDTIVAYDIAWEPRIGAYDDNSGTRTGRKQWDDDFTAWVKVQYGSIEAAETAWGTKADRTASGDLLVTDDMLNATSDKYQKLVAAYYRFIDDQISTEMTKIIDLQKAIPNQLFSFRMSMSGSALRTSSFRPSTHCFDFQSLASSMAFMQPEGYQLTANTGNITDETALQIEFVNAYARYTQPDAPVVWKEFGKSVWAGGERGNFFAKEAQQISAEAYYRAVMEHCYESYTSGMFCWYFSGGYRIAEKSDYGILNPDGSDRPLTALLREYAPKFINQGERKDADTVYIAVERDDHVGGIFGMFASVKSELAKAFKAGKSVTFINASQDELGGYAYADEVCTESVGNTEKTGIYPLRYVNGLVKGVETYSEGGKTYASVTVCNTKQSVWRAGTVKLISYDTSAIAVDHLIEEEVGYMENVTLTIPISGNGKLDLRFEINGIEFGPLFSTTVR